MAIKKFENFPDNETPLNAENINENIDAFLKILGLDIDTFSTSKTYALNDFVVYQNMLWRCTVPVTSSGVWTGVTNWVKDSILVES